MKKRFLLFVFCIISIQSFAQWGVKGGINFSSFTNYSSAKDKTGFHLGVTYDKNLSNDYYIQTGMLFASSGTNLKPFIESQGGHVAMYGFELPLNLSFRPRIAEKMNLIADLGIYARYGLFGDYKYLLSTSTEKGSPFDAYNRFDLGLNLGVGLQYKPYLLGVSYQLGLTNAEKEISDFKNKSFRISIGYKF